MCNVPVLPVSAAEVMLLKRTQATAHVAHRACPHTSPYFLLAGLKATPFLCPCSLEMRVVTHKPQSLQAFAIYLCEGLWYF